MNVGAVVSAIATIAWIVDDCSYWTCGCPCDPVGNPSRGAIGIIIGSITVALIATITSAAIIFVQPTDRGVVISALDEGIRPEELQPGLNFVVPFLENVLHYPVERQTYTMSIAPQEGQIVGDDSVEARDFRRPGGQGRRLGDLRPGPVRCCKHAQACGRGGM